jgi:hypothetical protein
LVAEIWDKGKMSQLPFHGLREASCVVTGVAVEAPLKTLLDVLFVHQPRMTGWPPWVDSRTFADESSHPYVTKGGWEALIYAQRSHWKIKELDFWRIEPTGRLYAARTHEDDTTKTLLDRGVKPGSILDFLLLISRTAEIIGTARAFTDALRVEREKTTLQFAFRWSGLKGREICCWVEPGRQLFSSVPAEDDEVISTTAVPQDAPDTLIWEFVKGVTEPVFNVFGAGVGDSIFQEIVNRTLTRQL